MTVICGENREELSGGQILVCHHCGTPVCETHGRMVLADDAFASDDLDPDSVAAMHCRGCAEKFHAGADRHGWVAVVHDAANMVIDACTAAAAAVARLIGRQ